MLYDDMEIRQRVPAWSKPVDTRLPGRYDSSRQRLLEQKRREPARRRPRTAASVFRRVGAAVANLANHMRLQRSAPRKIAGTLLRIVGERNWSKVS